MKRNWITNLIAAVIISLLTLLLWLQNGWMSEAREAERDRMQRRVEADTRAFAEDFNREIQAAYFNFQTDPSSWEQGDLSDLNERYDFWKNKTDHPELVSSITYLPSLPNSKPIRYDPEKKSFYALDPTEELSRVRSQIDPLRPRSLIEDMDVLVVPLYKAERGAQRVIFDAPADVSSAAGESAHRVELQRPLGHLIVKLNLEIIVGKILPALGEKYFPGGEYAVSVADRNGTVIYGGEAAETETDATARLFDLTPDSMIFFRAGDIRSPRITVGRNSGVIVNQKVESSTLSKIESGERAVTGNFSFELRNTEGSRQRSAIFRSSATEIPPWRLDVRHVSGSIGQYIDSERRKGLVLSLAIYLLIVGSILVVVISAHRVRRFAQRQVDFVSSVSHEFRTPLAVIYSASENLADGVATDDSQIAKYGDLIKGEGKKLSNMVEQILEFAGARSGKRKYNFETVSVAEIVNSAIEECSSVLEEHGIKPIVSVPEGLPLIEADRGALSLAIQNLINNAVKYSDKNPWLRVSVENGKGRLSIEVEDRGMGISKSDLKHIFESFYRSKTVVDAQINGNGLGLSLVKEIAESHGGRVQARSEEGKGSRFTIEIPISRRPYPDIAA